MLYKRHGYKTIDDKNMVISKILVILGENSP